MRLSSMYYFTLEECLKFYFSDEEFKPFSTTSLKSVIEEIFEGTLSNLPFNIQNEFIEKFWQLSVSRFLNASVVCIPHDNLQGVGEVSFRVWLRKLINIISSTSDKYVTILSAYKDKMAYLMDNVITTSKNKTSFNDTPQNANTSGIYEGDNYMTTFTRNVNEVSSPMETPIERLDELKSKFNNTLWEWTNLVERICYEED